MDKKIAFKTLGCRLNQYETDALASQFEQAGYQIVEFDNKADAYIVNTCTVTNQGDKRSRYTYNNVVKRKEESALVVTGCMATHFKSDLEQNKGIDFVIDNNHKANIFDVVDSYFKGESYQFDEGDRNVFSFKPTKKGFHTRSMIKIQDGCDNFCTYCIVPHVRGRAISRPPEEIIENIKHEIAYGFKEIVLTGVNITRYDYQGIKFDDLLEQILHIEGNFRVRISSIEPEGFGDKFFELLQHPKLAPHLHMCLQSGSNTILHRMRRMYQMNEFTAIMEKVRSLKPDFNFTTDIIVGFPGENDELFEQTVDAIKKLKFTHSHTFKYSTRDNTRAARMDEQVDEKVKTRRSEVVRLLAEKNKREYRSSFIGKEQTLLVERIENGIARGYGEHYVPIKVNDKNIEHNRFYKVKITGIEKGEDPYLLGEVVE